MGKTTAAEWECDLCGIKELTKDSHEPTGWLKIKRTVGFKRPKNLVLCHCCQSAVVDERSHEAIKVQVDY